MGLTAAFYLYYGMFLGFFWVMLLVWHYVSGHRMEHAAGFARKMVAIAFIGIVVALPFALSYIEQALHGELAQLVPYGSACPSLAELTDSRAGQNALDLVPGARKRLADDSLPLDVFWNTWSVEGFISEGLQPAELGWGTHEKWMPKNAKKHKKGCQAASSIRPASMRSARMSSTICSGRS